MAFPTNPTNGQQANVNGVIYIYSTTLTAWTVLTNTGANVSANNVAATNNIAAITVSATGNIVTQGFVLGNGSLLTGVSTTSANINNGTSNVTVVSSGGNITASVGGTSNVAVFATTGEYVTGLVSVSGNVTAGNIVTAGIMSSTGNAIHGNILTAGLISATGNATAGNVVTAGLISATGNVTGGNIRTAGTVSAAGATFSGSLNTGAIYSTNEISASGAVTGSNIYTTGAVSATGNVQGNYVLGNGSQLTGISSGNSSINITVTSITANYTIAAGQNGLSVGPMNTGNNVQVSIANGQRWIIL
jgi:hypothetical protein